MKIVTNLAISLLVSTTFASELSSNLKNEIMSFNHIALAQVRDDVKGLNDKKLSKTL